MNNFRNLFSWGLRSFLNNITLFSFNLWVLDERRDDGVFKTNVKSSADDVKNWRRERRRAEESPTLTSSTTPTDTITHPCQSLKSNQYIFVSIFLIFFWSADTPSALCFLFSNKTPIYSNNRPPSVSDKQKTPTIPDSSIFLRRRGRERRCESERKEFKTWACECQHKRECWREEVNVNIPLLPITAWGVYVDVKTWRMEDVNIDKYNIST